MIVPVILSGGEGKRLWPLSSATRPKQFLTLFGEETLLQQTVRRLHDPAMFAAPIIVGAVAQRFLIAEQLRQAALQAGRIVLEPIGRNTAPALAVGALLAHAADPDALIFSAHADHAIPDPAGFRATIARGVAAAGAGHVVLFGLAPTFPATQYGYIEPGAPLSDGVRKVTRFLEKPERPEAVRLCAAGSLWNSGLFLMRADRMIAELEAHAPQVLAAVREAIERAEADPDFLRLDPDAFAASPSIAIDHAVMERTAHAVVVAADFVWSDIGSWSAVWEVQPRDAQGNAVRGPTVLEDVSGCLVFTEGPQIAACGISGLVIVATAERVLIVPREHDQMVRTLAERSDAGGSTPQSKMRSGGIG